MNVTDSPNRWIRDIYAPAYQCYLPIIAGGHITKTPAISLTDIWQVHTRDRRWNILFRRGKSINREI
jgi:hypothetical protein